MTLFPDTIFRWKKGEEEKKSKKAVYVMVICLLIGIIVKRVIARGMGNLDRESKYYCV